MREKFHLDVYNIIIIALIPFVLLVAWGLTWGYERNLHAKQCEAAIPYLEEVAEFSGLYTNASSISDIDSWLDRMEQTSRPEPANDLHNGAMSAATYASSTDLPVDMSAPGGLYDQLTTFKDVLDEGRTTLVNRCPETAPLIDDAFPMYFREGGNG